MSDPSMRVAFKLEPTYQWIDDLSVTKYKNMNAADVLNQLLGDLQIPTTLPGELPDLQRYAADTNRTLATITQAIVSIRNNIVHPERKAIPKEARVQAWLASVWCLELVILAILGYNGQYMNRIARTSQPQPVPWAPTK